MTDETEQTNQLDRLIEHLVDGDGSESHWDEFRQLAATDHEPWQRLAERQRQHALLQQGLDVAVAPACAVELPIQSNIHAPIVMGQHSGLVGLSRYSGWAAAIVLALLWVGSQWLPGSTKLNDSQPGPVAGLNHGTGNGTTLVNGTSPQYVSNQNTVPGATGYGSVLGTTQTVLLGMNRLEDGTLMAVYARGVVECSPVEQFYGREWDETDRPVYRSQPANDTPLRTAPANIW